MATRSNLDRLSLRSRIIAPVPMMLWALSTVIMASLALTGNVFANVCPFCQAINLTFAEQLEAKDVAVVAKLLKLPKPVSDPDADLPKASMEITKVLKGGDYVAVGMKFNVVVVGTYPVGQQFLVMGVNPPEISWTTPMKASDRVFKYLETIQSLPESGADRLAFFQDYFEDEESVLAFDAYDEFAKAPYEDLINLKPRMPKEKLVSWIKDPELSHNRRRLYLTMLGVCGGAEEAKVLEGFIESGDRRQQAGLDALLASYLTLKGADGLPLIVDTFLKNSETEYVDVLAAVQALRFHGTEVDVVPKKDIVAAVRHVLDRPRMADMVIPDLARWEDWSVMERLVKMFKDADDDTNWLRVPVITYLRECPKPEAAAYIEELAKIDPDAVTRADFFSQSLDGFGDEDDSDDEMIDEQATGEAQADSDTDSDAAAEKTAPVADDNSKLKTSELQGQSRSELPGTQETSAISQTSAKHTVMRIPTEPADSSEVAQASATNSFDPASVVKMTPTTPANPTLEVASGGTVAPSSAAQPPAPVAAMQVSRKLTLGIIFIPMAVSVVLFIVLWSVVSGWFERLIF
ncbi:hypothetical protein N9L06_07180 [Mariniblastus sp.]|nr:hypothetical protein [Mariniblastus sp.]